MLTEDVEEGLKQICLEIEKYYKIQQLKKKGGSKKKIHGGTLLLFQGLE